MQVVGRDGDWVLIVSKKGNPPGYIEMASIEPSSSDEKQELSAPPVEGKYESLVDTRVYSGPGFHYPVVAEIKKGTKINVVDEEKGWLKVESRRGNKPGYVEASIAKPVENQWTLARSVTLFAWNLRGCHWKFVSSRFAMPTDLREQDGTL